MHKTTVYRWLRAEAKNTAVTGLPTIKKTAVKPGGTAQVKWLPVTEKASVVKASEMETGTNQTIATLNASVAGEIRVQIGSYTIITPDGFKCETLESVCRALQHLC